jgi:hypothetical protein
LGGGGGAGGLGGGLGGLGGGGGDGASGHGGHAGHGGWLELESSVVDCTARMMKRMTRKKARHDMVRMAFRLSPTVNPKNPRGRSRKPPNSARTSLSDLTGVSAFLRTMVFCPGVSLGPGDSFALTDGLGLLRIGVAGGVSPRFCTLLSGSGRFGGPFGESALNFDAASMECIMTAEARGCCEPPVDEGGGCEP